VSEVRIAELERAVGFARAVASPLAEVLSRLAGATILIESPQAERAAPAELAAGLSGVHWVVPVEIGGVHSGAMCVLVPRELAPEPAAFTAAADEFLARASDRLTAAEGGAVSLDRLGLREIPAESAGGALVEALGPLECIAVRFAARRASEAPPGARREVTVVFGGRLVREFAPIGEAGETVVVRAERPAPSEAVGAGESPANGAAGSASPPPPAPDPQALVERAKGLPLRLSAELGRRRLPLGELLGLGPGSSIDMGRSVTEPIELRAGGRLVALVDAVLAGGRFGVRVRGTAPRAR